MRAAAALHPLERLPVHVRLGRWLGPSTSAICATVAASSSLPAAAPPGWSDTSTYVAETGWVDEAKIQKYAFPPSDETLLFVCGLPGMYDALCGPRTEPEVAAGTVLDGLGYTKDMVAKM